MVFYIIACHKAEHSEEALEHDVQKAITAGGKQMGELFRVNVRKLFSIPSDPVIGR